MIGHKWIDSPERHHVQEPEVLTQALMKHHLFDESPAWQGFKTVFS